MTAARSGAVTRARRVIAENRVPVLVGAFTTQNVLRIVSNLVLTRLLAPQAFGVVGVISSIHYVLQLVTDAGFHAFVVRSREADDRHFINVIWTLRLIRAVALTALMFVFAGTLAGAFDKPELETPVRAASFLFLLEGLHSLHAIRAERARRISYISVLELCAFIVQMTATIVMAFLIPSFWALIIGMYIGAVTRVVFSYTLYPGGLHAIAFDRRIGGDLWRFARIVVLSSMITIVLNQADKIFIGRSLGLDEFGLYMLAVNLTLAAMGLVRAYAGKILFPLYAETFRNAADKLNALYYSARRRMTALFAFGLGGAVGGGSLIVRILFDDRYLDAGVFVSLLSLGPLFALITLPAEQFMVANGRIRATLTANIFRLAWLAVAAPLGLYLFGVIGLVAAFALMEAATAPFWWTRLQKLDVLKWREEAIPLCAGLLGAAIGFAAERLATHLIATGVLPAF